MAKRIMRIGIVAAMLCFALVMTGCQQSVYQAEEKTPILKTPTIGVEGTLRVGVNTDNPPLAGESTKMVGIDIDIAAAMADQFGLKVSFVKVGTDTAAALKSGNVDIVMGADSANADADLWKSSSYLQTAVCLFSKNKNATVPAAGSTTKIAAQTSSLSSWAATSAYTSDSVKNETDLSTAFQDLENGTVDFVAADAVVGAWAAHTKGLTVYPVAVLGTTSGYSVCALASNASLVNSVNTAMNTLNTNGIIRVIQNRWLGGAQNLASLPVVEAK